MMQPIWSLERGDKPLVATAIHDGHAVRDELEDFLSLSEMERCREEDPFTGIWTEVAETRIVGLRSRFEVDLNRPREKAVYQKPEDAWGLQVWKRDLPPEHVDESLAEYDAFYSKVQQLCREMAGKFGRFVVYDLHTYNHRRDGADAPPADPEANPQVNVGTGTMDRERWASVIDRFVAELSSVDFPGGKLDVRENVKFRGGEFPRWIHEKFPDSACVLSIEFKKFFMDEWTGAPDHGLIEAIRIALESTIGGVLEELEKL